MNISFIYAYDKIERDPEGEEPVSVEAVQTVIISSRHNCPECP